MKAPGWLKIDGRGHRVPDKTGLMFYFQSRPWHPSFWPTFWRDLEVKPGILKPVVFFPLLAWLSWKSRKPSAVVIPWEVMGR